VTGPIQSPRSASYGVVLRPSLGVRIAAVAFLGLIAALFALVGIEGIRIGSWPGTLVGIALACGLGLGAIHNWTTGISIEDRILVIHGLRPRRIPLSDVAQLKMSPSQSIPGLQMLSFIGTDGGVLWQLSPLWDVGTVASWAERVPIRFVREQSPRK
jgi:hypothetical protein